MHLTTLLLPVPSKNLKGLHKPLPQKARETQLTMPELPEVEAARRAIEENCLGKKIKRSVVADDAKVIDGVSSSDFETSLTGKTIVAAHRKGKNMWIQLDSPPFPSFQFGMAGAIYIKGVAVTKYKRSAVNDTDEWPSKYSKLFIELDDGLELSFTDKRRFAKVRLLQNPSSAPPISELGPDALLEPMTENELFKSLSKKKIGIKALLLDQNFISGVGNWIADEVLYQARIHPLQSAASISKERCAALHNALKEVIEKAVEVGADSSQFPSNWIFHNREKKPGKAFVDGKKIDFITAGGRTSAYVPELQKLSGDQAGKEVAKGKKSSKKSKDEADEAESEDEETAKPKGGKKTTQSRPKKPPAKRKSKKSEEDSSDDEGDEVAETKDEKPATKKKPKGSTGKSKDEADEAESEDEETAKPKGGKKTTQSRPKKPPAKRKSKKSEEDSSDDEGDEVAETKDEKPATKKKPKGSTGKRPSASKKSPESEDNSDDSSGGEEEVEEKEDKRVQVKGKKGVAKKVPTGRQTKKRGK